MQKIFFCVPTFYVHSIQLKRLCCSPSQYLVCPLAASEGFTHLFTVIDRTTRWAKANPLQSMSAAACAHALFPRWIARFGVLAVMTSDRVPTAHELQFTSSLWSALCSLLGIQHVQMTAYHPECNRLVKRISAASRTPYMPAAQAPPWLITSPG